MEDNRSGSSSSSSTEKSVTNYKKENKRVCKICKEDDDVLSKCYRPPLPPMWLCEVCRTGFPGVVEVKPEDSNETANSGRPNHSLSSTSSRVDGHGRSDLSGNETSATNQPSQSEAHTTSPEASSPVSIGTSPVSEKKQSESDNETSASESEAHTSQASSPMFTDTSSVKEQRGSDSNTPSGSESTK